MTPMVERMARAMARADFGSDAQWATYLRAAHAGLSEMREPTEKMVAAGGDAILGEVGGADLGGHFSAPELATKVWRAMIDAARGTE